MFEKYNEDVTGFAMFKFKNPADFYAWTDGNPEFAEGDYIYIYIDPTQPFMGSTCDTGYGEGIYDICDDHGRPLGNYDTMAFSAKEVMAYLVRVGTRPPCLTARSSIWRISSQSSGKLEKNAIKSENKCVLTMRLLIL